MVVDEMKVLTDLRNRGLRQVCVVCCDGFTALPEAVYADAKAHPGAAGSLPEGLGETLAIACRGVPPTLAAHDRSTNAIESMIESCRDHSRNVKRWRDGEMMLRAGMLEAAKQFRRVNGHMHLRALRVALDQCHKITVTPTCEDQGSSLITKTGHHPSSTRRRKSLIPSWPCSSVTLQPAVTVYSGWCILHTGSPKSRSTTTTDPQQLWGGT